MPDIADHSSYYIDVINWLVAHPEVHTNYLIAAPQNPSPAEQAVLAKTSCDATHSVVCGLAWAHGYRLSRDFYKGDRAVRESGFDISFRFGPFSGSTHHYAAVGLNSLLYKYERDLADFADHAPQPAQAAQWKQQAEARRQAINKYLWNPGKGMFFDYDFTTGNSPATFTRLSSILFGAAWRRKEQAAAVDTHLALLDRPGGLASSTYASGLQWDLPFGWAPLNWLAADGLWKNGYIDDARRVAEQFTHTIRTSFEKEGTIHEKYNVETGSSNVELIAGYQNVIGFGWTNAVYVEMEHLLQAATPGKEWENRMTIKHVLPPPERRAFGQSRRKQVRRQEQNRWRSADRQTDPIDALAVSAVGRVPALLAIKWQRMAASPFGFFRGAVPVMAADLAVLPHTGIFTQLCGDAHVRNLGAYAAPDGRLVFDINDFDETIRGPV